APRTLERPPPTERAAVPGAPGGCVGAVVDRARLLTPIDISKYETVTTTQRLETWIARARDLGVVCVDTQTASIDPMQAKLCGVALAVAPNEACYIPCGHSAGAGLALDSSAGLVQIAESELIAKLKPLLEDEGVLKIAQNLKYDFLIFLNRGVRVAPYD